MTDWSRTSTKLAVREGMHGAPSHPTKRLHKSTCSPSAAKILPLRGADCSALRRTISFMGEARRKRLQVRTKSTKTRSSPRRFWKSRSRSSILHGAPARQLAMHWATPGKQWLLPLRHSSSGAWLKPCPWLGIQLGQRLTLTALFAALFAAASSPPHLPMHPRPLQVVALHPSSCTRPSPSTLDPTCRHPHRRRRQSPPLPRHGDRTAVGSASEV